MKRWAILALLVSPFVLAFFYFRHATNPKVPVRSALEKPNLLFITIDTLRPDRLGAYGYQNVKTPIIDALASGGILFQDAICQTPLTLVSHSSIFTGLNPNVHGVRDNAYIALGEQFTTLAEILKSQGYETGAFIGSGVLDKRYGLSQGFDYYSKYQPAAVAGYESQRRASEVAAEAQEWLDTRHPNKFFLWLHLYDPHFPYDPPEPFRSQYSSPYDGEIAYTDVILGRFLAELRARAMLDNTIIVLAADHGESLGEHREEDHGYFIYDATLKIPLIFHWSGGLPAGKIISEQVQSIDILPTLGELMGFSVGPSVQGKSLMPLIRGQRNSGQTYAYAESFTPRLYYGWSDLKCIRTREWKYIEAPQPELYNLLHDPGELNNVAAQNSLKVQELRNRLKSFLQVSTDIVRPAAVDAERMEQLAALGYVGIEDPARMMHKESTVDPKTKVDDYLLIHKLLPESVRLMNQGNFGSALERLKKVESRFVDSFVVYWYLGYCYANAGKLHESEKSYVRSIQLNPLFGRSYTELALTLALLRRHRDAIRFIDQAPAQVLTSSEREQIKGEIYTNAEAFDEAEKAYTASLQADPQNSEARYGLARVYLATKRFPQAVSAMRALADEMYPSEDVYDILADFYEESGAREDTVKIYQTWMAVFPSSAAAHYKFGRFLERQKVELQAR